MKGHSGMNRVAKFEKVSKNCFIEDWIDTFGGEVSEAEQVYEKIKLPKRATKGSAGYDFFSTLDFFRSFRFIEKSRRQYKEFPYKPIPIFPYVFFLNN